MLYRKKPVIIEAFKFSKNIYESYLGGRLPPHHVSEGYHVICNRADAPGIANLHIHTLEGAHIVTEGDWVIKGVKGEYYPCKPDIFEQTYELVI